MACNVNRLESAIIIVIDCLVFSFSLMLDVLYVYSEMYLWF